MTDQNRYLLDIRHWLTFTIIEMKKLKKYYVFLFIALIPIMVMAGLLWRYSVNVPFWDQWEYVTLVGKLHHGTLGLHDLWMQHNEHRILFPRIVTLIVATITGYNIRYEIFLNFITATV